MKGYTEIMCGAVIAFAIAIVAGVIILSTQLLGQGAVLLGFTKFTLVYYVACLCISIAMLIASPAAREKAKLMALFAIAVIMVVLYGFQNGTESGYSSGDQFYELKGLISQLVSFITKGYMYVVPAVVTVTYALIAVGAQEARNEAKKRQAPSKD